MTGKRKPSASRVATLQSVATDAADARVVALPSEPSRDAELLLGLVARRPRAVAEAFDRFAPLVRSLLSRMLGDTTDVDDLTQETFLILLRRSRDIDDPSRLRSFVVGTTIRIAKNELRRRRIRHWVGLDDVSTQMAIAPHDIVTLERIRRLYGILDRLDSDARALFVLRYVEGLELDDVAEAVGCSLATVKRRLSRANKRFRAMAGLDPTLRDYLQGEES